MEGGWGYKASLDQPKSWSKYVHVETSWPYGHGQGYEEASWDIELGDGKEGIVVGDKSPCVRKTKKTHSRKVNP